MDIEKLFNEHVDEVYNFLVYFTKRPHTAEDLVQDTFIKAMQNQQEFRGGSPRAWLLQIARNTAIDLFRKKKNEWPVDVGMLEQAPYHARGPEELAENNDIVTRLLEVFSNLNPDFRDVILCRLIMDMSSTEAANVLGWTPGRVRVMLHRALRAIRKIERKEVWLHGLSE